MNNYVKLYTFDTTNCDPVPKGSIVTHTSVSFSDRVAAQVVSALVQVLRHQATHLNGCGTVSLYREIEGVDLPFILPAITNQVVSTGHNE